MSLQSKLSDLTAESFLVLRAAFFGRRAEPQIYQLREKRNTQDDPFDEYVYTLLTERLPSNIRCVRAPGPLITPDLVIMRPEMCDRASRAVLATDLTSIVAMEVKKLERTRGGAIARSSGMDYNTTPPCGTVRVYGHKGAALDIRGFYLFVCQEEVKGQSLHYRLSALALCDGNLLNADFNFYLSIVGERTKEIGLGTYGDGANRSRPMLIFANPLGASELDHKVTLIHPRKDLKREFPQLRRVGLIKRTVPLGSEGIFHCYRLRDDVPADHTDFELVDPFRSPTRGEKTQPRGRFRIDLRFSD